MIQEALENILVYPLKDDCINSPCGECQDPCYFYKMKKRDYEILKALVDRATPKLVLKQWDEMRNCTDFYRFDCPNCESNISKVDRNLMYKFCPFCGQVLDWEDLQNAKM